MKRILERHWDLIILGLLIILYTVSLSILSISRHNAFASNFDLANMDQTIWNTLHGRIFTMSASEGNVSRLATHADLILILLSPLYLIWDNVRTLLIAQSIFLGLGVIPVFLLAKRVLKNKVISLILSSVYLLNPALQWTNIYDFHGVALAIPFLLFTFYFAYIKNWKWYFIFFFLSLVTKEEIGIFLGLIGLTIWLIHKNWKVGFISMLIGFSWFLLMIFIVIPHFNTNGQHWAFNEWFVTPKVDIDHHNLGGLVGLVTSNILSFKSLDYYSLLLRPFGFLPLLGFPWILLSIADILINITSTNPGMQSINLHYTSGIIPALMIATIFGFKNLLFILNKYTKLNNKLKNLLIFLGGILLVVALKSNFDLSPLPSSPSCWCVSYQVSADEKAFEKVLQSLPTDVTISASSEIRPHMTHRENAFNLPMIPGSTRYIAVIDEDRIVGNYAPNYSNIDLIKNLLKTSEYTLKNHIGHFYLFERR